jgi:hypothetical protein
MQLILCQSAGILHDGKLEAANAARQIPGCLEELCNRYQSSVQTMHKDPFAVTPEFLQRQQVCCLECIWQTGDPHSVHDAAYRFTQEELLAIDLEGRCVVTDHEAFILFNLYGPAITSEENAAERFAYKMQLYQVMFNCQGISLQACCGLSTNPC